ncbi:MAG TPA: PilZ domain-containing protein [Bryobacteraceae bacterium]|nr:PilZ domain-containing protein [Bryobacteraceae bacterium]
MAATDVSVAHSGPEVVIHGPSGLSHKCMVFGLEQGKMRVRNNVWIEPETRVRVQFGHLTFAGIVTYCIRKDSHYSTCIDLMPGHDERREPRLTIQRGGHVSTLGGGRPSASAPGVLLDLAVSGMRLHVPCEVEPGTMVFVEMESELVAGEVRRCARSANGNYEAGVTITDVLSSRSNGAHSRSVLRKARVRMAHVILGKGMEQPANFM